MGDLGLGERYLRRLVEGEAQFVSTWGPGAGKTTDAVNTPTSWMNQWTAYHPRQRMDRKLRSALEVSSGGWSASDSMMVG